MECKSIEVTNTLQNWLVKPTEAKKLNDTQKEKLQKKINARVSKSRTLAAEPII